MPLPPDPVAFTIPALNREVYWYGILVTMGVLFGAFVADREARRRGQNPDHVWNALIVVMIFGLLGARIYHILSQPAESGSSLQTYLQDPLSIINVWNGGLRGLGVIGAIAGGVLGLCLYVWEYNGRHLTNFLRALTSPFVRAVGREHLEPIRVPIDERLSLPQWADIAVLGVPLGQAIGRWGNYVNQELYGRPTTLPWGVPVASEYRLPSLAELPAETRFHPTFLYESILCLVIFAILVVVSHRWGDKLRTGDVALLYLILYPVCRVVIEFQRPDAWVSHGIAVAQIISVAVMALAALAVLLRHGVAARLRRNGAEV
jgi:phosphatidylglycerol---prolipoprotein diacylglyceryl transferase